jgi:F-type H+-transporting ATPase subunit alpha
MGEVINVVGVGVKALVINISEDNVKAIVLSGEELIMPGFNVTRTKDLFRFPVSSQLLGRVIDTYGNPIDSGKSFKYKSKLRDVEIKAPGIISRYKVNEPLQTGVKAVDSLIPIGRGQRELIIGDKSTGKTAVALDTILNQKNNA